jgi:hypothetical protein
MEPPAAAQPSVFQRLLDLASNQDAAGVQQVLHKAESRHQLFDSLHYVLDQRFQYNFFTGGHLTLSRNLAWGEPAAAGSLNLRSRYAYNCSFVPCIASVQPFCILGANV